MRVQEFDDDGRLRHRTFPRLVTKHRHLGHGPHRPEGSARNLIAQIDDDWLEGDAVLVQGDECLVAERRKGTQIELERHAQTHARSPTAFPGRYYCTIPIQPTPKRSATMSKRFAKNVLPSG